MRVEKVHGLHPTRPPLELTKYQEDMVKIPQGEKEFTHERVSREGRRGSELSSGDTSDLLEKVRESVDILNKNMIDLNRSLRFTIYEGTKRLMVEVIDLETCDVIKEIPPEEVLEVYARINKIIGVIVDELV